jgi:hypothetical protein
MMELSVICRTEDDRYKKEAWPTSLPRKPEVGEQVVSASGKVMRIAAVTPRFNLVGKRLELELVLP